MRFGGWHRLWIVASLLYLLVVLVVAALAYEDALNPQVRWGSPGAELFTGWTFTLWMAAWWLVPCLAVYAFGWVVWWIYSGFKTS